jgi:hypothetical protein
MLQTNHKNNTTVSNIKTNKICIIKNNIYNAFEILFGLQKQTTNNFFFLINKYTVYNKNNRIYRNSYITKDNWFKVIPDNMLGYFRCYYLHGMGYKCNNAINTLYFSVGKSQWDNITLQKGAFCYTVSRKNSWRKLVIKNELHKHSFKKNSNSLMILKKKRSGYKKRKLRTRVKLLRNYHGLLFIYTLSRNQLNKIGWSVQRVRIPNVYTGKGIHYYKKTFKPQERKLKSFIYKK